MTTPGTDPCAECGMRHGPGENTLCSVGRPDEALVRRVEELERKLYDLYDWVHNVTSDDE